MAIHRRRWAAHSPERGRRARRPPAVFGARSPSASWRHADCQHGESRRARGVVGAWAGLGTFSPRSPSPGASWSHPCRRSGDRNGSSMLADTPLPLAVGTVLRVAMSQRPSAGCLANFHPLPLALSCGRYRVAEVLVIRNLNQGARNADRLRFRSAAGQVRPYPEDLSRRGLGHQSRFRGRSRGGGWQSLEERRQRRDHQEDA